MKKYILSLITGLLTHGLLIWTGSMFVTGPAQKFTLDHLYLASNQTPKESAIAFFVLIISGLILTLIFAAVFRKKYPQKQLFALGFSFFLGHLLAFCALLLLISEMFSNFSPL